MVFKQTAASINEFVTTNGRHMLSLTFILGFIIDLTALPRIDHPLTRVLAVSYMLSAIVAIIIYARFSHGSSEKLGSRFAKPAMFIAQFFLGSLASMMFVYYFRSSELIASWPIILLLFSLLLLPEVLRTHFARIEYQSVVLYVVFMFFMIFTFPIMLGKIGAGVYFVSLLVSLLGLVVYLSLFCVFVRHRVFELSRKILIASSAVTLLMLGAYLINIIPPIPLTLKEVEVAHGVSKQDSALYLLKSESLPYWKQILIRDQINITKGSPVYFYSAVYAPKMFGTSIIHEWQIYDENNGSWSTMTRITYPISGGGEKGYRGYSYKENVQQGKWRVNVKTPDGRTVGRKYFTVRFVEAVPILNETVR